VLACSAAVASSSRRAYFQALSISKGLKNKYAIIDFVFRAGPQTETGFAYGFRSSGAVFACTADEKRDVFRLTTRERMASSRRSSSSGSTNSAPILFRSPMPLTAHEVRPKRR
jgi:hypothetical protein